MPGIHLGVLPMSFNFLSLVLGKVIANSCCKEELSVFAQNMAPADTDFVIWLSHFLLDPGNVLKFSEAQFSLQQNGNDKECLLTVHLRI